MSRRSTGPLERRKTGRGVDGKARTVPRIYSRESVEELGMSFEPAARPSRASTRRWMVRLFETSDKLEEHLNKSNLRPDQVTSISIDQDGFFVVVYWVGSGPPPDGERRPARSFEDRPPPRRRFEDDEEGGFRDDRPPREERPYGRPPPRRDFGGGRDFGDRGGRDFPQRRPPRR